MNSSLQEIFTEVIQNAFKISEIIFKKNVKKLIVKFSRLMMYSLRFYIY